MDVVFAGTSDVGGGHVAVVVGCVTAEQVRQVGLCCVQLLFACGLAFSGKVRTAQGGVAQTGNQTGGTVDYERFVAVAGFADGNLVGQREADAVFVGAGQDVAVAFDAQAVTQFLRTGRAVVGGKGQTFVVHRVFRRDAFGDVGFGFVGQVEGVIGNTVGVFRTFADFNRTVSRLAEGGLVGIDGVLGVVAVHFFADGHVLTGDDGGGFFGGGELFVQLGNVDGVGVCRTFGYVGNLVAAVVQAVLSQADGLFAAVCCRSQRNTGCRSIDFVAVFIGNAAAVGFERTVAAVGIAQFDAFGVQQVGIASLIGQFGNTGNGFGGIAVLVG